MKRRAKTNYVIAVGMKRQVGLF